MPSNYTPQSYLCGRIQQRELWEHIDWDRLASMTRCPEHVPKLDARFICPHDAGDRTKAAALGRNNFNLLICDIDDGDLPIEQPQERLTSLGVGSAVIYSTASHLLPGKGRRWRVIVQLASGVPFDKWEMLQLFMAQQFGGDASAVRPAQIAFCPNYSPSGVYEEAVLAGAALDPYDASHPLVRGAMALAEERAEEAEIDRLLAIIDAPTKPPKKVSHSGGASVISAFNLAHSMADLLATFGYRRRGKKWLHPDSTSGIAGVTITEDGKYLSSHGCDRLADRKPHDCFDVYAEHVHRGDFLAAVRAAGNELIADGGKTVTEINRESWRAAR